jgi:hypothetical protein
MIVNLKKLTHGSSKVNGPNLSAMAAWSPMLKMGQHALITIHELSFSLVAIHHFHPNLTSFPPQPLSFSSLRLCSLRTQSFSPSSNQPTNPQLSLQHIMCWRILIHRPLHVGAAGYHIHYPHNIYIYIVLRKEVKQ